MTEDKLVDSLQEAGYEPVETELPGGWATDGDRTVIILTERAPGATIDLDHRVWVLDAPASEVGIDTTMLARTHDSSSELAIRRALDHAADTEEQTDD